MSHAETGRYKRVFGGNIEPNEEGETHYTQRNRFNQLVSDVSNGFVWNPLEPNTPGRTQGEWYKAGGGSKISAEERAKQVALLNDIVEDKTLQTRFREVLRLVNTNAS